MLILVLALTSQVKSVCRGSSYCQIDICSKGSLAVFGKWYIPQEEMQQGSWLARLAWSVGAAEAAKLLA